MSSSYSLVLCFLFVIVSLGCCFIFYVAYFSFAAFFVVLDFVFLLPAKRLAGKSVSDMTYFVLSGM